MKKFLTTLLFLGLFSFSLIAQAPIMSFDSMADSPNFTIVNEGPPSAAVLSNETSDFQEGSGALKVQYTIGSFHPWGSFTSLVYNKPEAAPFMDFTGSSYLKIWIKVLNAPANPDFMFFRLHIGDQPNGTGPIEEYIYENATALDAVGDWFELEMPLIERVSDGNTTPNNEGFVVMPLGWGGARNNGTLDLDAIVNFTLVATTIGWTDPANIPADSVTVLFDFFNRDGAVIPVELTSFSAVSSNQDVILNWITATEVNNLRFEIERKSQNSEYQTVGSVQGKGTTTEISNYSFVDKNLNEGTYTYRLKQIDFDGTTSFSNEVETTIEIPLEYSLNQNYPNPFNPSTSIEYSVVSNEYVSLKVYDIIGNEVATLVNEKKDAGKYSVNFDASNLTSGVYIYKLSTNNFVQTKKMMLVK